LNGKRGIVARLNRQGVSLASQIYKLTIDAVGRALRSTPVRA